MIKKILIALCLMCVAQAAFAAGRGYLGVWFATLPATEKAVQTGVIVKKVFAGSAAQQAGLKPGQIITKINGVFVRDPRTAVALTSENAGGERIWLTVIDRTGGGIRQSDVFATLAANPPSEFAAIMTAKPRPPPRHSTTSSAARCAGTGSVQERPCRTDASAEH